MEHINEAIAALIGAGAWGAVHYYVSRRKDRGELDDYAARMIRDENNELRQRINLVESYNAKHIKAIAELEKKVYELTMKNEILQAFPFHIPLPMWSVDRNHCYDYVNEKYVEMFLNQFGIDTEEVLGKNLFDVWPRAIAAVFVSNNQRVMNEDLIMNDFEKVSDALGNEIDWRIIKMKRPYPLGVVGIAIPKNGMFDKMLRKIKDE